MAAPVDQAQTGTVVDTQWIITPVLGALIGVGAALGLVTFSIMLVICCKNKTDRHSEVAGGEKESLAPDIIPSITGSKDYESGFDLYKQKNFPTPNNRPTSQHSSEGTRHKNVFIVDQPSSCCVVGRCTTMHHMRDIQHYSHNKSSHDRLQYSPVIGGGADIPLLAGYRTTLPSSDLTQSDTDTSLISSERDRESEV